MSARAALDRLRRGVLARLGLARTPATPRLINWDLTYACPLRCTHCYSESGRRPARQLPEAELLRIADVFLALRPIPEIVFTGGEPLLVKSMLSLAEHLSRGGARLALYTSGYTLDSERARAIAASFDRIAVSIDGDDAAINDAIRGKQGAYDEAIRALELFDGVVRDVNGKKSRLGVECSVVRSNLRHLDGLVRDLPRRFSGISFVTYGAAIPTGLGSERSFAETELLDDAGLASLRSAAPRLKRLAPESVHVRVLDNFAFQMRSDQVAHGQATDHLVKIEADGRMRAMDIYEGTVGHVLDEPFDRLWARAVARHRDPFVMTQLQRARTMQSWAAATRAIDLHFASPADRARIERRRYLVGGGS
jgi:MoaA/NifB/PqqE/SkfB family radical SAM enzyme